MTTMAEMEALKAAQRTEAEQTQEAQAEHLRAAGIDPRVQEEIEEPSAADDPNPAPAAEKKAGEPAGDEDQNAPKEPVRVTPSANARSAIANRFKGHRGDTTQGGVEGEADLRAQGTMYGAHTVPQAPKAEEAPEQDQVADPAVEQVADPAVEAQPQRKIKLKVRGQEIERDENEVIALAQQAAAADDYLGEARRKLDQADQILSRAKDPRGTEARQHPDENDPALSIDPDDADPGQSQHPETVLEGLMREIRFGDDDKEAAAKLGQYLTRAVQEGVAQEDLRRTMQNDANQTRQNLAAFFADKKNADIADEMSQTLMRDLGIKEMRQDLQAVGIDAAKLPTDPVEIRNWHRYLRVTGQNVRTVSAITDKVAGQVRTFRGGTAPNPQDSQPAPRTNGQPRVAVDRQERRLSVPQQPSRATPLPAPPQARTPDLGVRRSAVVQQMRAKRGQIVAN